MTAFVKFQPFVEHLAEGVHNLGTGALTIALTNTAPNATDATLSQITEIAYTNLSTRVVTVSSSSQTSGTYSLVCTDLVLTSTGGTTGPFRYVILYNDTPTSPADPLIAYWDYGAAVTLQDTETFTVDFGANVLTLA